MTNQRCLSYADENACLESSNYFATLSAVPQGRPDRRVILKMSFEQMQIPGVHKIGADASENPWQRKLANLPSESLYYLLPCLGGSGWFILRNLPPTSSLHSCNLPLAVNTMLHYGVPRLTPSLSFPPLAITLTPA